MALILAIDQGTTGTTALVLDARGRLLGRGYAEFTQYFPRPGWVEHDAEEIWRVSLAVVQRALRAARVKAEALSAIGITNQRETTVVWDRVTSKPIARAIVWQDRRTAERCAVLGEAGHAETIRAKTGLVVDAYFSGTKLEWLLSNVRGARDRASAGRLAFGTIDSWLVWRLTGGAAHVTEYTNASRTLLFNIYERRWDPELLDLLGVPESVLPRVQASAGPFGHTTPGVIGKQPIPITGIAGDQQAALFGQLCTRPGMVKNTYGTGCFVLMLVGDRAVASRHGLVTTLACAEDGRPAYALEGSVFVAGAAIQWLRDGLGVLRSAPESERLAREVKGSDGVYLVPAFVGLGAPYWDPHARGALLGLTRGTTRAHVVRAALESIAFQSRDVIDAMSADARGDAPAGVHEVEHIRADGGAAANDFLMQFQADQLGVPVDRPKNVETTALGAAYLAGMGVGLWSPSDLARMRTTDRIFKPKANPATREALYAGWKSAVARVRSNP